MTGRTREHRLILRETISKSSLIEGARGLPRFSRIVLKVCFHLVPSGLSSGIL